MFQDEVEKLNHREHHQRLFLQDLWVFSSFPNIFPFSMEGHKEDAFADERGKQWDKNWSEFLLILNPGLDMLWFLDLNKEFYKKGKGKF